MEVLKRSKIELKGNVYDFYESEEFFKDVPLAYQTYQKAQKAKKAGKVLGYASLGSLGIGAILIYAPGLNRDCDFLCQAEAFGLFSTLVVFPFTGIIAIISSSKSNARLKKAAEFYNGHRDEEYRRKDSIGLSLGLSQNGIGLTLYF